MTEQKAKQLIKEKFITNFGHNKIICGKICDLISCCDPELSGSVMTFDMKTPDGIGIFMYTDIDDIGYCFSVSHNQGDENITYELAQDCDGHISFRQKTTNKEKAKSKMFDSVGYQVDNTDEESYIQKKTITMNRLEHHDGRIENIQIEKYKVDPNKSQLQVIEQESPEFNKFLTVISMALEQIEENTL